MANDPNTIQYVIQEDGFWYIASKDRTPGVPEITVSSKGVANGLSTEYNDGYDFGPDSYNPSVTSGVPLTQTGGMQEAITLEINTNGRYNGRVAIKIVGGGNILLNAPLNIPSYDVFVTGDNGTMFTANVALSYMIPLHYVGIQFHNITFNGNNLADNICDANGPSDDDVCFFENCSFLQAKSNAIYCSNIPVPIIFVKCLFYSNPWALYSQYPNTNLKFIHCAFNGQSTLNANITSGTFSCDFIGCYDVGQIIATGNAPNVININAEQTDFSDYNETISDPIITLSNGYFSGNDLSFALYSQPYIFGVGPNTRITINNGTYASNGYGSSGGATMYLVYGNTGATGVVRLTNSVFLVPSTFNNVFNAITGVTVPVLLAGTITAFPGQGTINIGASTTISGTTAGTLVAYMPNPELYYKKVIIYLNGYENDSTTAQTYTYPVAFTTVAAITSNTASVPVVSTSLTEFSIAPDTTTAYTGIIVIEGY